MRVPGRMERSVRPMSREDNCNGIVRATSKEKAAGATHKVRVFRLTTTP